jgi:hypothetical protein
MGRKRLPPGETRDAQAQVRMTRGFHDWLMGYLKWKGVTLARYLEDHARRTSKRDKYQPPPPEKR